MMGMACVISDFPILGQKTHHVARAGGEDRQCNRPTGAQSAVAGGTLSITRTGRSPSQAGDLT
jgi:hypothetical protein